MKLTLLLWTMALSFYSAAGAARANVYDFSYFASGGPSGMEYGQGVITLSDTSQDGYYDVLDVQGSANNAIITGLSNYAGADNVIYTSGPFASQGGISIATAAGLDYNLFSYDGSYHVLSSITKPYAWASNSSPLQCLSLSLGSAAPEPSTWLLMSIGLGAVGIIMRRSTKIANSRANAALAT